MKILDFFLNQLFTNQHERLLNDRIQVSIENLKIKINALLFIIDKT